MSGALAMMLGWAGASLVLVGASAVAAVASSTTLVIDKPSGVQAGDLLVAIITCNSSRSWTGDTGWSEQVDASRIRVATLIATGLEGSTFTFTASGTTDPAGVILAYRSAALDVIGSVGTASAGSDVSASGVTLSADGILLGAFGVSSSGRTMTTPSGMLPVVVYAGSFSSFAVFSQQLGAGATGTRTSSPGGGGASSGVLIGIKGA